MRRTRRSSQRRQVEAAERAWKLSAVTRRGRRQRGSTCSALSRITVEQRCVCMWRTRLLRHAKHEEASLGVPKYALRVTRFDRVDVTIISVVVGVDLSYPAQKMLQTWRQQISYIDTRHVLA